MAEGICSVPECQSSGLLRRGKCYKHYWEEHGAERDKCSASECSRNASRRGLCGRHYQQWRVSTAEPCSVEGCSRGATGRGYCSSHLRRLSKYGDPEGLAERMCCAWDGCEREITVVRSRSGLCSYHNTRVWKKANPESVNASNRQYNRENADAANAWRKKWLDAHPEKRSEYAQVRHARKLSQFVEYVSRNAVFERDGGICGICHEAADPANWHLDHVMPLARGGEHSYANVQVAHPFCNISKGAKIPPE